MKTVSWCASHFRDVWRTPCGFCQMTFCVTSRFNEMRPSFLNPKSESAPLPLLLRESAIERILCGNRSIVPAGEGHAAVSSIDAHAWAASTYMTSAQNTQPGGGGGYQGEIRSLQICRTSFLHRSVEDAAALRIRPPARPMGVQPQDF